MANGKAKKLEFALNLYRKMSVDAQKNLFISPFSISTALAMLLLGSKENTAKELKETLQHRASTDEEIHALNMDTLQKFLKLNDITLETASKLFPEKSFAVSQTFYEKCLKYYDAQTESLNFLENPEDSRKQINEWVEQQTKGKITDFLPGGSVRNSTKLVLANAIYFKGNWLDKFKETETTDMDFFVSESEKQKVKMMTQKRKYNFTKDEKLGVNVVELPYKNEEFSMLLFVPTEKFGLGALEKSLTPDIFESITSQMFETEVILGLPRMKFEYEVDLVSHLQQLGISDLFEAGKADLTGLSNSGNLHVSGAFHKAVIEVNEEGSEAAAATGMLVMMSLLPLPPEQVICDHPFMFVIRHIPTSTILFVGRFVSA